MHRWLLGATACLAVAGVARAADLPTEKINGFHKGVTTKAEILASLGAPQLQTRNPDGRSNALYDYTVPLTEKNRTVREMVAVFVFDAHDVLLDAVFYAKKPPGEAGAAPAASPPALQDENVLTPLPEGFKVGFHARQPQMEITEQVPNGETVQDWSRMVTEQTFFGRGNADPDVFAGGLARSWAAACPGGSGARTERATENGYPASLWAFRCPLNPQTGKPETMWMKVIGGADALYSVQYAYRRALTDDLAGPALAYLKGVQVCDTRAPAHPCPPLRPVVR